MEHGGGQVWIGRLLTACFAVGAAIGLAGQLPTAVGASAPARNSAAPHAGVAPRLSGRFRVRVEVTSGGKPFGQHRGDTAHRTYRFEHRCRAVRRCDRVRLVRKGRRGRFGSELKRRGRARWRGVEKVHGRCDNGLDYHSTTIIDLKAKAYRGAVVSKFKGHLKAKVRGCVRGREHVALKGRKRRRR